MTASMYTGRYKKLRSILVKRRRALGLNQTEVAKKIGVRQPDISKMERGTRRIDVVEMMALAKVLGLDPHDIINELQKIKS